MSYLKELKNKPYYSLLAQRMANSLPHWSKARTDKYSNYQTIMSDMLEQFDALSLRSYRTFENQFHLESNIEYPVKYYKYQNSGEVYFEQNSNFFVAPPTSMQGSLFESIYQLERCSYSDLLDLNYTLPLEIDSITSSSPVIFLENKNCVFTSTSRGTYDGFKSNSTVTILVNTPVYLGFALIPKQEDSEIILENFYAKRRINNQDIYIYSLASICDYETNESLSTINLFPVHEHNFAGVYTPGLYRISMQLLSEDILNDYLVQVVVNHAFPSSNKKLFYNREHHTENKVYTSYLKLKNENLSIESFDLTENSTNMVLENFTLLNEFDESIIANSFTRHDDVLYVLENPEDADESSKIYVYDIFLHGAKDIYEDNDNYILDIVCDKFDYKPGDEIVLETRMIGNSPIKNLISLNLQYTCRDTEGNFYYLDSVGNRYPIEGSELDYPIEITRLIENDNEIKWKFTFPENEVGTFSFVCEGTVRTEVGIETLVLGKKIINLDYKIPYRTFELDKNYSGYEIGYNPDQKIILRNNANEECHLNFIRDGWIYDRPNNIVYTSINFDKLIATYGIQ